MNDVARDNCAIARHLIRGSLHGALGTLLDGQPYVSLVALACDAERRPLLLLSDLAQHTRNLRADPRISLLLDDVAGHPDPLAGARLSLIGQAELFDEAAAVARFVARHPGSASYAGFGDFHLYRITVERGHLVAGFGRIAWVDAKALQGTAAAALVAAEAEIVAHMNADHRDALSLYAENLLRQPAGAWLMTGIDPDGIDLRCEAKTARIEFDAPVLDPAAARQALVALASRARRGDGASTAGS